MSIYRREAGLRVKGKPYSSVLCILFLTVSYIGGAIAIESAATTTIHAQVMAKVVVTAPSDALSWEINPVFPGIYSKTQMLKVKANTDWQLTVRDTDSDGYMREWIGHRYGLKMLANRMRVSADKEVILRSIDSPPIIVGTKTGGQGVDVQVTFTQEVTSKDEPLPQGEVYRKVVTFTGSPKI
jgi:hypothetical protein